jgi:hypothetical protein
LGLHNESSVGAVVDRHSQELHSAGHLTERVRGLYYAPRGQGELAEDQKVVRDGLN